MQVNIFKKSVLFFIIMLGMIHIWRPSKLSNFQDPPHPLVHLRPKFFDPLDLGHPISSELPLLLLQMITSQLKENNPRMNILCYQVLPSGRFSFSYQLINLVWLSFDFFSFNWSLTICYFVALYSRVCSYQLCSIIHILSTLSYLIVGGSN